MPKDIDALVIAAGPPKLGKPGGAGPLGESEGGAKVRAARRFRMALERKDDGGIAAAFKEMYNICAASHDEPGDDEPDEDDAGGY